MIIFILTIRLINNNKSFYTVARIFFISSILNIVVQLIVYFKPQPEYSILLNIIYEPLVKEIQTGEYHGRFFAGFFYDGALLAFTYFYLFLKSKSKLFKIFYIIWTTAIFFIAQISNFRIVLVVALMSLFGSLLIHFQKKVVLLLIVIFIGLYIGNVISTTFYSSSSLGRLLFTAEDSISTITTRIELWKKAVNIWSYSPIIGIGLGNYYDFLDSKKTVLTLSEEKNNLIKGTMQHPHNIFFASLVETGLLGLLSIILLLVYLGVSDIQLFFKADKEVKYIIISYWVLFISSMTGPRTAITYLGLLWLLRGLIINKTSILDIKNHGEVNKA
jgi:O-antigen ligase